MKNFLFLFIFGLSVVFVGCAKQPIQEIPSDYSARLSQATGKLPPGA